MGRPLTGKSMLEFVVTPARMAMFTCMNASPDMTPRRRKPRRSLPDFLENPGRNDGNDPDSPQKSRSEVVALKSSKAPTNYFTPNILRKSWSRLVVSVVHLDALAFPVAAT